MGTRVTKQDFFLLDAKPRLELSRIQCVGVLRFLLLPCPRPELWVYSLESVKIGAVSSPLTPGHLDLYLAEGICSWP